MEPAGTASKKRRAAARAAAMVESDMMLGLGTGTTADAVPVQIADRILSGAVQLARRAWRQT